MFATKKGDWVLDPFAGRGTTGIVCASLGRNFTGMDLYSENIHNANRNIKDAQNGKLVIKLDNVIESSPTENIHSLEQYLNA
jgi:DNA modification methylase